MRYRPLGDSGIQASVVGFGAWAIGGWWWGGSDDPTAIAAIHQAIDLGMNLIDTAPVYGLGKSEDVIGRAIAGRRHKVVLSTKCGLVWHVNQGLFHLDVGTMAVRRNLTPEAIRFEVEESLTRLRTDYIDLYQTHWQDPQTPIEETMDCLLSLKKEGKIRAIGVSNATTEHFEQYRKTGRLDTDQEKYSMLDRQAETAILPYCREHGLGFLAYSPLAQGLLTGKVGQSRTFSGDDQRLKKPRFSVENRARVQALLEEFQPIAEQRQLTLAQTVIAWTVAQPGITHALCGARNPQQGAENAAAGDVALSQKELDVIDRALARHGGNIK